MGLTSGYLQQSCQITEDTPDADVLFVPEKTRPVRCLHFLSHLLGNTA